MLVLVHQEQESKCSFAPPRVSPRAARPRHAPPLAMLRHIQRLVAGAMQPGLTSASSSSACSTSGTAAFGALHLRLLASPAAASSDTTTTSTSGSPEAPVASTSGFRRVQAQSLEHSHGFLQGIVHINNTLNNIIVALTDEAGNLKALVSAGQVRAGPACSACCCFQPLRLLLPASVAAGPDAAIAASRMPRRCARTRPQHRSASATPGNPSPLPRRRRRTSWPRRRWPWALARWL